MCIAGIAFRATSSMLSSMAGPTSWGAAPLLLVVRVVQRPIQGCLEVDEAGVGGDVLKRKDLRRPIATDAVFAVDPVEAVGQPGPHQRTRGASGGCLLAV